MAVKMPIPFLRSSPWDVDWTDEGRLEIERYAVVATAMIGEKEHLIVLTPIQWTCQAAEAARLEWLSEFPDAAIIAFPSAVDPCNAGHAEGVTWWFRRYSGFIGEGVQ